MSDWIEAYGWFYSSLSQVSAAIVGLIGAIWGGRLLDRFFRSGEKWDELENTMNTLHDLISDEIRYFEQVNVGKPPTGLEPGESPPGPAVATAIVSVLQQAQGTITVDSLRTFATALQSKIALVSTASLQHRLRTIIRETRQLALGLFRYQRRLSPGALWLIFPLLGLFTFVGIILPLSVLPAYQDYLRSKAFMLSLFAICMVLLGFFLWVIWKEPSRRLPLQWQGTSRTTWVIPP